MPKPNLPLKPIQIKSHPPPNPHLLPPLGPILRRSTLKLLRLLIQQKHIAVGATSRWGLGADPVRNEGCVRFECCCDIVFGRGGVEGWLDPVQDGA